MGGTVFLQAMSFALKKKNLCNVHFQEGVNGSLLQASSSSYLELDWRTVGRWSNCCRIELL